MGTPERETFACPACAASFAVSEGQKDGLLEHGCALCGTTISPSAFA